MFIYFCWRARACFLRRQFFFLQQGVKIISGTCDVEMKQNKNHVLISKRTTVNLYILTYSLFINVLFFLQCPNKLID